MKRVQPKSKGVLFFLAFSGLSVIRLFGIFLGGFTGVLISYVTTAHSTPPLYEVLVWATGGVLVGLFCSTIFDMPTPKSGKIKSTAEPGSGDPKFGSSD